MPDRLIQLEQRGRRPSGVVGPLLEPFRDAV
jgi:hypothetical protein